MIYTRAAMWCLGWNNAAFEFGSDYVYYGWRSLN